MMIITRQTPLLGSLWSYFAGKKTVCG